MREDFETYRITTTRGYRRLLDRVMREALLGKRSTEDVARMAAACKVGAELFMSEKVLARAGEDQEPKRADDDRDGSFKPVGGVRVFRRKKIVVKTGCDKAGARIDDKTVSIETSADDADSEVEAEIESLVEGDGSENEG